MDIPSILKAKIQKRNQDNSLRKLTIQKKLIDFSSNDFFGLAKNEELISETIEKFNAINDKFSGATGSRLISGNSIYHQQLEKVLADIHLSPSSLLLNSGYNANLSMLSSIPQKGDTILLDEKVHASIKEGSRLSFAKKLNFKHNNVDDLESKLKKGEGQKYVFVESLYSMDGDFFDYENILPLCEKYNALLIIDEAHTTGVFANGSGWCVEKGIHERVFARVVTFGKAVGCFGAAILGSKDLVEYLINFARPFIYTTALPLYNLIAIEESFTFIQKHPELRSKLEENISLFQKTYSNATSSYIQSIQLNDVNRTKEKEINLVNNGFDVKAILSPTVKEGRERLRVCLHSFNTEEEIKELCRFVSFYTFK